MFFSLFPTNGTWYQLLCICVFFFCITTSVGAQTNAVSEGQCDQIREDANGKKILFCCLDEIALFKERGLTQELNAFIEAIKATLNMTPSEAVEFYSRSYESTLHEDLGLETPCGPQIECSECTSVYRDPLLNFDVCGDGLQQSAEECDDGNTQDGDGCSAYCLEEGVLSQQQESSIPSNNVPNPSIVTPEILCGNGVLDNNEECDDGNVASGDGCNNKCVKEIILAQDAEGTSTVVCGDGKTEGAEECDDGNKKATDACIRCIKAFCGDGHTWFENEECDDGNTQDGDGCSENCTIERAAAVPSTATDVQICGNRIIEPGEECDDGNQRDFDGCNALCLLERGECGDGVVQRGRGEECEPGVTVLDSGDTCSNICRLIVATCGNGVLDVGEQCDQATFNANTPNAPCRTHCASPVCGDGIIDFDHREQCDDGNRLSGDGCGSYCTLESIPVNPAATVQPLSSAYTTMPTNAPWTTQSGPALLLIVSAGAAAGWAFSRR